MTSDEQEHPASPLRLVLEFYRRVGKTVRDEPTLEIPAAEVRQLLNLLDEETTELKLALGGKDLIGVADALGDIIYVVYGAALQLGLDLDRVVEQIHLANMSKPNADGSIEQSLEGKILKGDSYRPPALGELPGIERTSRDSAGS